MPLKPLQDSGSALILIPRFVRLYEEIIHELWLVDYLSYMRTNGGNDLIPPLSMWTLSIAKYLLFSAKVDVFWQGSISGFIVFTPMWG